MAVGAISGTGSTTTQGAGFGALTSDKFIKVLLSELSQQDPFQPQDSSKLLEQFSSLRNIESQLKLQETLESVVTQTQMTAAGGMIGKSVMGLDADNNELTGVVRSVRLENGKVFLELTSGQKLSMDRVTQIGVG